MQRLFCSLQTFSAGKQRLCFPLQINRARRLGRMLFRMLYFGQDPGINLSAVGSSQSSVGHGQASVYHLAWSSWNLSALWYLAAVSTQYFFRRKITTYFFQHPYIWCLLPPIALLIRSAEIRARVSLTELPCFVSLPERCSDFFMELLLWSRINIHSVSFIIIAILPPSFARKPLIPWPLRVCSQKAGLMREYELLCLWEIKGIVSFNEVRKSGKSISPIMPVVCFKTKTCQTYYSRLISE